MNTRQCVVTISAADLLRLLPAGTVIDDMMVRGTHNFFSATDGHEKSLYVKVSHPSLVEVPPKTNLIVEKLDDFYRNAMAHQ